MEKLTEKINSFKVSKTIKDCIINISEQEEIHIQQACRKLLRMAINEYLKKIETIKKNDKNIL